MVAEPASESWTSWALSYVPGMAPVVEENTSATNKLDAKFTIGLYITLVTFTLKRTNQVCMDVYHYFIGRKFGG